MGIDLVQVDRLEKALARTPAMADRLFTPAEQDGTPETLAGRFAAKEALAKALGGPSGLEWTDAEVFRADSGQPHLELRGTVARRAEELGVNRTDVSISHDGGFATAIVVVT